MSTQVSGRELAKKGFSVTERELFFLVEHPEFKNYTPYLLGTFRTCQCDKLKGRRVELDEAYEHIYVTDGGCTWCKAHFETLKKPLEELYQGN